MAQSSGYSAWIRQQQDLAVEEQRQRLDSQNAKLAAIRQDTARRRKEQERRLVEQKNEQERQRQMALLEHKQRLRQQNQMGSEALRAIKLARRRDAKAQRLQQYQQQQQQYHQHQQQQQQQQRQQQWEDRSSASRAISSQSLYALSEDGKSSLDDPEPVSAVLGSDIHRAHPQITVRPPHRHSQLQVDPEDAHQASVSNKYEMAIQRDPKRSSGIEHGNISADGTSTMVRNALQLIDGPTLNTSILARTPKNSDAKEQCDHKSSVRVDANAISLNGLPSSQFQTRSFQSMLASMELPLTAGSSRVQPAQQTVDQYADDDNEDRHDWSEDGYLSSNAMRGRSLMLQLDDAWKQHQPRADLQQASAAHGHHESNTAPDRSNLFRESVLAQSLDRFVEHLYSGSPAAQPAAARTDSAPSSTSSAGSSESQDDHPGGLPTILESTLELRQSLDGSGPLCESLFTRAKGQRAQSISRQHAAAAAPAQQVPQEIAAAPSQSQPPASSAGARVRSARPDSSSSSSSSNRDAPSCRSQSSSAANHTAGFDWRAKVQEIKRKMSHSGRSSPAGRSVAAESVRSAMSAPDPNPAAAVGPARIASVPVPPKPLSAAAAPSPQQSTSRRRSLAPWAKSPPRSSHRSATGNLKEQSSNLINDDAAAPADGLFADHLSRMRGGSAPVRSNTQQARARLSQPVIARHDMSDGVLVERNDPQPRRDRSSSSDMLSTLERNGRNRVLESIRAAAQMVAPRGASPAADPVSSEQPEDLPAPTRSVSPISRWSEPPVKSTKPGPIQRQLEQKQRVGPQQVTKQAGVTQLQDNSSNCSAPAGGAINAGGRARRSASTSSARQGSSLAAGAPRTGNTISSRAVDALTLSVEERQLRQSLARLDERLKEMRKRAMLHSKPAGVHKQSPADADRSTATRRGRSRAPVSVKQSAVPAQSDAGSSSGTFEYVHPDRSSPPLAAHSSQPIARVLPQSEMRSRIGIGPAALVRGRHRKTVGRAYVPAPEHKLQQQSQAVPVEWDHAEPSEQYQDDYDNDLQDYGVVAGEHADQAQVPVYRQQAAAPYQQLQQRAVENRQPSQGHHESVHYQSPPMPVRSSAATRPQLRWEQFTPQLNQLQRQPALPLQQQPPSGSMIHSQWMVQRPAMVSTHQQQAERFNQDHNAQHHSAPGVHGGSWQQVQPQVQYEFFNPDAGEDAMIGPDNTSWRSLESAYPAPESDGRVAVSHPNALAMLFS